MFENLLNLVKEHAGDAIVNNPAIKNENNDEAINTAAGGIMDHLKGLASNGGVDSITKLFANGQGNSSSEIQNIGSSVATNLMNKFGIDANQAGGIVGDLIPKVMNQLVSKTNDPNDSSFDLNGIIGSLTSGGADGVMDKVKGLFS